MKLKAVLTAALLLVPTAALAAPGIVTETVGVRAGPGTGFPLVDRIPGGSRVDIHGCLRGYAWCDVSWADDRGWVSSQYLEYLYRRSYVYLPDYVDVIDVPVVPFVLSSYWSSYYAGRPWYQRRAYWTTYWTSHESVATRLTIDQSAARIGRAAARDATIAVGRTPRADATQRATRSATQSATVGATHGQNAAQIRSAREAQGRAAAAQARMTHEQARVVHENRAARANARMQPMERARMQPPAARVHEAPRTFAAPAARPAPPHVAQPNISRGAPMSAHAQMPAPRAAPAMPHAAAPAAPHGGGGPVGGGGHDRGHEQH